MKKKKEIEECLQKCDLSKIKAYLSRIAKIITNEMSVREFIIELGKETSMWKSIEFVKNKKCDIIISSGNTGALLVISKLLLKTIDGVDKPPLAGLCSPTRKS